MLLVRINGCFVVKERHLKFSAFCTPEYLFGTSAKGKNSGTVGQYSVLLSNKDIFAMIAIDEAHKIFDRDPSYRPEWCSLKIFLVQ